MAQSPPSAQRGGHPLLEQSTSPNPLTPEEKVKLLKGMLRSRFFEAHAHKEFAKGKMGGWLILTKGQESLPFVLRTIMGPHDHTISGPRGIAAAISSGIDVKALMAEYFGKSTGSACGKGGAFSLFHPDGHHWGSYATAAGQTPLAAGFAFALKYRQQNGVSFCFLGDGACNQGAFHESLNLSALFKLPVVYIIENNNYAMGTSVERSSSFKDHLAKRAEAYNLPWQVCQADQIEDLRATYHRARVLATEHALPSVIEVQCYRYFGFSIADANAQKYRTPKEIEYHKKHHDPIKNWQDQLLEEGLINPTDRRQFENEFLQEMKEAVNFAETSPPPEFEDLTKHVYKEIDDTRTDRQPKGRHFFND